MFQIAFSPRITFCAKSVFWSQNAPLAPKVILGEKCDLEQKVPLGTLTNSHTPSPFRLRARSDPKKWIFAPKITFWLQNRIFALFATLGPEVPFLRKSALFRPHAADAYKTNGILIKMEPFSTQKRFWTQKCILEPKIDFWAQNAENEPKVHFWAQKCTFRKSDQKVNVRLNITEGEQGIPDSGPDSIHGRPGLLKHVAFSVPLHSNKIMKLSSAPTGENTGGKPVFPRIILQCDWELSEIPRYFPRVFPRRLPKNLGKNQVQNVSP